MSLAEAPETTSSRESSPTFAYPGADLLTASWPDQVHEDFPFGERTYAFHLSKPFLEPLSCSAINVYPLLAVSTGYPGIPRLVCSGVYSCDLASRPVKRLPFLSVDWLSQSVRPSRWNEYVAERLSQMEDKRLTEAQPTLHMGAALQAWYVAMRYFPPDTPTPSVVPSGNGGVQFVWHKGGWDVEFEVENNEIFIWARSRESKDTWHGNVVEVGARFLDLMQELSTI